MLYQTDPLKPCLKQLEPAQGLAQVYIGLYFLICGESTMEWLPQFTGDECSPFDCQLQLEFCRSCKWDTYIVDSVVTNWIRISVNSYRGIATKTNIYFIEYGLLFMRRPTDLLKSCRMCVKLILGLSEGG